MCNPEKESFEVKNEVKNENYVDDNISDKYLAPRCEISHKEDNAEKIKAFHAQKTPVSSVYDIVPTPPQRWPTPPSSGEPPYLLPPPITTDSSADSAPPKVPAVDYPEVNQTFKQELPVISRDTIGRVEFFL